MRFLAMVCSRAIIGYLLFLSELDTLPVSKISFLNRVTATNIANNATAEV